MTHSSVQTGALQLRFIEIDLNCKSFHSIRLKITSNIPYKNTLEDDQFEYGPTSAKSAPNRFLDEEEPMSYEDFGASLKRGKNPRR